MSAAHWAEHYIGDPWIKGEHECGHFFVRVQAERFGNPVQLIDADACSLLSCARALDGTHPAFLMWPLISEGDLPREGDCVQMSHSRRPHHIGVWVDVDGGGVLHCVEGLGVVFSTRQSLRLNGWNITAIRRRRSGA